MAKQHSTNASFAQQYPGPAVASSKYIPFTTLMNTMRYQHAVGLIGQRSLVLVLENLIQGDIDQIMATIRDAMGGCTCISKLFTDVEILKLEEGNPSYWDVTLLYKVDQLVCGLAPMNSGNWIKKEGGDETLENLLHNMKQLRNQVAHNFHKLILCDLQLETSLEELRSLSVKILKALIIISEDRENVIEIDRVEDFQTYVDDVITDVRKQIVEL